MITSEHAIQPFVSKDHDARTATVHDVNQHEVKTPKERTPTLLFHLQAGESIAGLKDLILELKGLENGSLETSNEHETDEHFTPQSLNWRIEFIEQPNQFMKEKEEILKRMPPTDQERKPIKVNKIKRKIPLNQKLRWVSNYTRQLWSFLLPSP